MYALWHLNTHGHARSCCSAGNASGLPLACRPSRNRNRSQPSITHNRTSRNSNNMASPSINSSALGHLVNP